MAKAYAYAPLLATGRPDHYELSAAYVADATAVTAEQLSKAGVRLAYLLNRVAALVRPRRMSRRLRYAARPAASTV